MKRFAGMRLRAAIMPLACIAVVGAMVSGCGDKESDPDAVTVDELRGPGKLMIADNGDGDVTLTWTGSNNEDDFDGYNVYGVKTATAGDTSVGGLKEGQALQLLDDDGEPVAAAKEALKAFNYSPDKGLGLAAPMHLADEATSTDSDDDETEFEALPIHSKDSDGERLLPTCKHTGGKCVNTTAATKGMTVEDDNSVYAVNGPITYSLKGLKVGSTYCFIVMSTMDGGKEVSQTSTNMACVTPSYKKDVTLAVPTEVDPETYLALDFATWIAACNAASDGMCPEPGTAFATDKPTQGSGNFHVASDPGPIYVEYSTSAKQVLIAGKNSAIADLGYYADGLSDLTLPKVPMLTLDDNLHKPSAKDTAPILNGGGYAIAGQSITMTKGHVYALAIGDAEADSPTSFYYVLAYVVDPAAGTMQFRLPKDMK